MDISEKLKQARIKADLTQEYVAGQLGISRQTMSNWENGRSCPDIASVLKLSELYGLSLDSLLKDSSKEKDEDIHFLQKHWYTFYHCAIATLPLASLVSYFGFPVLAMVLRVVGLLLFSLPRLLFHRLFGGGLKNVLLGILGWCIMLFYYSRLPSRTVLLSVLRWCGIFLVLHCVNREFLSEKQTTSRVVTGLILMTLLIMFFDSASTAGVFSEAAPFDHVYRVDKVLYQADEFSDTPIVELALGLNTSYLYLTDNSLNRVRIGEFTYVEPAEGDQKEAVKGIWQLVPEHDADTLYRLTVEADDSVILSCSVNDLLQWKYRLKPVDILTCTVSSGGATTSMRPEWFEEGTFHGDLSQLDKADILKSGTVSVTIDDPAITELSLWEEYFHDGTAETAQYTLRPENHLELQTRYNSGQQYAIYRIPYENGEFIFCINYSN